MKEEEEKIIEVINTNLDKFDINKLDKTIESNNIIKTSDNQNDINRKETINSVSSSSFISNISVTEKESSSHYDSLESIPFKEEADLDLPNFTSTKYNTKTWIITHTIFYSLFTITLIINLVFFFIKIKFPYIKIITDLFFFCYNFMNWFHYKRGCLGKANLNSNVKSNIDKSLKAKILRSEIGLKYFFSVIGNIILIYSDIYLLVLNQENPEFYHINFIGMIILSLAQILKIEKILINNRQYSVMNDLPNCFIEIFLFFGFLFFSVSFLIQMVYYYIINLRFFIIFISVLKSLGTSCIIISEMFLVFRYFFSSYDDLNTSNLSNATF